MNDHILTIWERGIIRRYLDVGERLDGFTAIQSYAHHMNIRNLEADLALVKAFLQSNVFPPKAPEPSSPLGSDNNPLAASGAGIGAGQPSSPDEEPSVLMSHTSPAPLNTRGKK